MANAVHPVIPVARSHQGQAVRAGGQAAIDGAGAMLVHRCQSGADVGGVVSVLEALGNRCAFNKRHLFIQQCCIACHIHIVRAGKRQPQQVVAKVGAHAFAARSVPPMLNIAFSKLA